MATAPDPDEVLRSTRGKENFQRISRLLISGGTTLLREIFDLILPPSNLPTILKNPVTEKLLKAAKLTKPQWDCLYPSPGVYGKSSDFDVTLLFKLLRTICNLIPPATGWDALPTGTDRSLAADLARIKYYRNSVYGHVSQNMEITDDEFPVLWQDISEVLVRIAGQINPTNKPQWQVAIFKFLKNPLTAEDERNVEELLEWYRNDMEVKESIGELKATIEKVQDGIEDNTQLMQEKVGGLETTVRTEAQDIKDQLGEMHQSIDRLSSSAGASQTTGARVRLRIDCETISGPGLQGGPTSEIALASQEHEAGVSVQGMTVAPITSHMRKAETGFPSAQDVLNLAASKYLKAIDPSKPEDLNGLVYYLERVRKMLIVDTQSGSLIITVECSSVEILEELWYDYCNGFLNKMAQLFLMTEDVLKELGLTEVKLTTTILEEEYRACREYLLQYSGLKQYRPVLHPEKSCSESESNISRKLKDEKSQISALSYFPPRLIFKMATAPDPDEVLRTTRGKENFQHISRLLISGGTTLLREIFDLILPPSNLPTILKNPATEKLLKAAKLTKPQWDCLYPSPGVYGKSTDFDVTLLFKLLRTICNLIPPATGWDTLPTSTDHSLAADLARIKYYRNSVYGHVNQNMEITDDQFLVLWQDISEVLVRIAGQISPTKKPQWQVAIFNFLRNPLTAEDERNVEELLKWYRNDMEVKEAVEELKSALKHDMKCLMTSLKGVAGGIEDNTQVMRERVQCLELAVQEETQGIKDQLGWELKSTAQEVQSQEKVVREECQDIKSQLEDLYQSIDRLGSSTSTTQAAGVQIQLRLECEEISDRNPRAGFSNMLVTTWKALAGIQRSNVKAVASFKQQATVPTSVWGENAANESIPSAQEVLSFIASKCFLNADPTNPEELNDFLRYMREVRQAVIVDTHQDKLGSVIITVECSSLEILEGLWEDYCTGFLNAKAQDYVTEHILKEFGLIDVKLKTTILENEYKASREYFLLKQELIQLCEGLRKSRDEFQNRFHDWVSARKSTRNLLKELEKNVSNPREGLSGALFTERVSSSQRRTTTKKRTEQREGPSSKWGILGGIAVGFGLALGLPVLTAVGVVAGVYDGIGGVRVDAGDEEKSPEIAEIRQAIDEDKNAREGLQKNQIHLGICVAELAEFFRLHNDSLLLLSSILRFLRCIMSGERSPEAAENAQAPILFDEVVNIDDTHVSILMGQLERSTANREVASIIQQILHNLPEGPHHEEIQTMIKNFIKAKFAQEFKA